MLFFTVFLSFGLVFNSKDDITRSDLYRQQAETLFDQEKYEESLAFYKKAFEAVKSVDKVRAANLCNDISSVYFGLQQFDESVSQCRKGVSLLNESVSKPDSVYFKLYSSLGTMFHRKAQADSSTYYFLLSDKLLAENQHLANEIPEYVLHHYLNQGRAVWRLYRYYDSVNYFEKALELSKRHRMDSELFYIYGSLAEVYDRLGEHEKALGWRQTAISHVPPERTQSRLSLYTGIGNTYGMVHKQDSALVWLNKSFTMLSQMSHYSENYQIQYVDVVIRIAGLRLQKGELARTWELLLMAQKFYQKHKIEHPPLLSKILLTTGDYERQMGRTEQALEYYDRAYNQLFAQNQATTKDDPKLVGYPKFALEALRAKTDLMDERYHKTGSTSDLETTFELYEQLIKLKKGTYRKASSSLEDRFFYTADTRPLMEQAILNGLDYYNKKPSEKTLELLFNRFEDANTTFLADIVSRNNDQSRNNLFGKPVELRAIQKQMDSQSAFISYKLIDNRVIAFVITKGGSEVVDWKIDLAGFETDLKSLMSEIKLNPGLGVYLGSVTATRCYDALMRPLEKKLTRFNRWVVVRDWKFSSLPFEILEDRPKEYLADRKKISYAYSASLFWFHPLIKSAFPKKRDAMVLAPFAREKENDARIDGWKSVATPSEVKKMGQEYLLGDEATKQNFIKSAADHYILNLATHAFADLKNPNSSYVQFYPGVDSKLHLDDIMNIKLDKTRLILLSSCFGNDGATLAGEGTVSLAYAFAQAGCPSLITSNWEANENTISFLSLQISKYIDDGMALDEAIQKARIDLRENGKFGKYDHPYFWANISLLGNYSPVYKADKLPPASAYYVLACLLLIALALIRARIRTVYKNPST